MADPDVQGGLHRLSVEPVPTDTDSYLYTAVITRISFMFRKIKSKCKVTQSRVMRVFMSLSSVL